jgi:hypothetical protein
MINFNDNEFEWVVNSINNEIKSIYRQSNSFNESDSWKYKKENESYIQILTNAKAKLFAQKGQK